MHDYFTKTLLQLKDKNLIYNQRVIGNKYIVDIEYKKVMTKCPNCRHYSNKVHDYRVKEIKHGIIQGYFGILRYRRRCYVCRNCQTKFPEPNTILDRYAKISNLTKSLILKRLENNLSFKIVSNELNVSSSTSIRVFDRFVRVTRLPLSEHLSFDEFKNKKGSYDKYAFCIVDPFSKKIIDVVKTRVQAYLSRYFRNIPIKERLMVKTITIDGWDAYRNTIKAFFPNAFIISDKFHFTRHINWAFNQVRTRVMNSYSSRSDEYKLLKKNWKILAKKPFNLTPYQMHIQDLAANMHPDLYQATILKDWFYQINACSNYDETLSFINDFLSLINESELKEFQDVIKTFINWKTEIINAYIIKANGKNLTNV